MHPRACRRAHLGAPRMKVALATSIILAQLCECGTYSLPGIPLLNRPSAGGRPPSRLLCTLMSAGSASEPPPRGGGRSSAGAEVGEAGDKKGFTILRVLSQGGDAGKQGGKKGKRPEAGRLDEALMRLDPRSYPTPSAAKKEIRKGAILVNGARGRVDQIVHLGSEKIAVQGRTSTTFKALGGAPFTIRVLHQDNHVAVVVKPPGVCTHPPPHSGRVVVGSTTADRMTMTVAVPYFVTPSHPEGTERVLWRPSVVHRLDKLTEGVQLVAKTKRAAVDLQSQFAARTVKKRYIAVIEGSPEEEEGTIEMDIGGKSAVSTWRVVHRTRSPSVPGTHLTTLALSPLTGRTHQLRIHCATGLGMPIVGDKAYGGVGLGCGLLLCAAEISFLHPVTREVVSFGMEEPERFVRVREGEHRAFGLGECGLMAGPGLVDGVGDASGDASDGDEAEGLSEALASTELADWGRAPGRASESDEQGCAAQGTSED